MATVKNFGDRVNPDAAKDPRAASAEETVLGLLLIFEEYRNAVESGEIALSEEDFVTAFHRRVFAAVMRLHRESGGVKYELLGMEFSPDEIGRIRFAEEKRSRLSENGPTVFRSAVEALKDAKRKEALQNGNLSDRLAYLREKQAKLHKGKAEKNEH